MIYKSESHKLHQAFNVKAGEKIVQGMPVALNEEGLIYPCTANVPKRGIGATTMGRVQDYADNMGISLYEALRVAEEVPSIGRSVAKIDSFVTFIQTLKSKADVLSVEDLLQEIIDGTGYVEALEAEDTEEARARIENIDELISKTVAYQEAMEEQDLPATLSGFLEEVALVADIDTVDPDQDYVLLMTLHSAKGLEFPEVFMDVRWCHASPVPVCLTPEPLPEYHRCR